MLQFVVEKIGYHAMNERRIGEYLDWILAEQLYLKSLLRHRRFVEIDHDAEQLIQIDFASRKSKCIRLGLGNIQRLVEKVGKSIQFVYGRDNWFGPVPVSSRRQRHFKLAANRGERAT